VQHESSWESTAACVQESLGVAVAAEATRPRGAVVIARDATAVQLPSGGSVALKVVVAAPAAAVAESAVRADFGDAAVEAVLAWAASKALMRLQEEAAAGGGRVTVHLDGQDVTLAVGKHLLWAQEPQ
jgi:hypothetical protein